MAVSLHPKGNHCLLVIFKGIRRMLLIFKQPLCMILALLAQSFPAKKGTATKNHAVILWRKTAPW
jgi:hypothetical protein